MKLLPLMILGLTVCLSGCRKGAANSPPMRYDTAVVRVGAGNSSATSPVSRTYGVSPNGERTGYGARLSIEDRIEVKYDFIGRGEYAIADTNPREWAEGDVYLFTILSGPETSVVPVVFGGQAVKVYESDEFTVTINPANNGMQADPRTSGR